MTEAKPVDLINTSTGDFLGKVAPGGGVSGPVGGDLTLFTMSKGFSGVLAKFPTWLFQSVT